MSLKIGTFTTQALCCRIANPEVCIQPYLCQDFLSTLKPDSPPRNSVDLVERVAIMSY